MRKNIVLAAVLIAGLFAWTHTGSSAEQRTSAAVYQGKSAHWWAKRAVQARKDANARAVTIKRLHVTLAHDPSVTESIRLATMIYPAFTEKRAWQIIRHESWMTKDPLHAYNPTPVGPGCHATGLYQFLDCTFRSTPFGKMSIYSPYAQSLAAGWMHQVGRGREWAIGTGIGGN
jgi:hypothetical protein